MLDVIIADSAGFCFGVKRAIEIARKQAGGRVKILGNLVNNLHVCAELEKRGVGTANSLDEFEKGDTVIITAHGIADSVIEEAKRKGLNVVDATCPFVKRVHYVSQHLEKYGYNVVVVGDKEHIEVRGIIGNLRNPIVVEEPSEVEKLKFAEKVGVVCQTTQSYENFNKIIDGLKKRSKDVWVFNTICSATTTRQSSARKLAKEVELVIVVGSRESANTKRLYMICSEIVNTKQVDGIEEIKDEWFKGVEKVGVTAGASTPGWITEEVVKKLKGY